MYGKDDNMLVQRHRLKGRLVFYPASVVSLSRLLVLYLLACCLECASFNSTTSNYALIARTQLANTTLDVLQESWRQTQSCLIAQSHFYLASTV